jgi:hypothetical protein
VVRGCNGPSDSGGSSDRPVLSEICSTNDGTCILTRGSVDFVGAAIRVNRALISEPSTSIRARVGSVRVGDVVFDQGIDRPAIDAEKSISGSWGESTRVIDSSGICQTANSVVRCVCLLFRD